jgi:hypothetical protein
MCIDVVVDELPLQRTEPPGWRFPELDFGVAAQDVYR